MRRSALYGRLLAALAPFLLVGCAWGAEEAIIEPAPVVDTGLGSGVRPLSFGPGDKSSPRVSPSGARVAFILDGQTVEKPLYARISNPRTELRSESVEWFSGENLAILGQESEAGGPALFLESPGDSPIQISEEAEAVDGRPEGGVISVTMETTQAEETRLMLIKGRNQAKLNLATFQGRITGLSISPNEREVIMAAESGEPAGRAELQSYRFPSGLLRRVALLDEGMEVLGAPQWTSRGIYFVAGKATDQGSYALYQVPEGSNEPVQRIGEGFLPASIAASPDGEQLAVVGRRNPSSPTDVYVLDPVSNTLEPLTANQSMEIKTDPRDVTWSPDGSYIVLVARNTLSGPEVYNAPVASLSSPFHNLYQVPVER